MEVLSELEKNLDALAKTDNFIEYTEALCDLTCGFAESLIEKAFKKNEPYLDINWIEEKKVITNITESVLQVAIFKHEKDNSLYLSFVYTDFSYKEEAGHFPFVSKLLYKCTPTIAEFGAVEELDSTVSLVGETSERFKHELKERGLKTTKEQYS